MGADGKLSQKEDIFFKPGTGPRHVEFAPAAAGMLHVYVVLELSNEVAFFEMPDPSTATVFGKQTISTLPDNFNKTTMNAAEISLTPDGLFVYVTNRQKDPSGNIGDNTFAVFPRDPSTGALKPPSFFPTGGRSPRHFSFSHDKNASMVAVANQDSNLVVLHKRNVTSGALTQVASIYAESPTIALITS